MEKSSVTLLLMLAVAAMVSLDLVRALRTGKARGRFGTFTRKGRPALFKRYVVADVFMLVLCAGFIIASLLGYV